MGTEYTTEDFMWEGKDNLGFFTGEGYDSGTSYAQALLNSRGGGVDSSSSQFDADVKEWIQEIKDNVDSITGKIDGRGINFIGIAASDPTQGQFKLKGETEYVVPRKHDLVVYGTKEYLYRKSEDGINYGWFELGDEDTPSWN